MTKPAKRTKAHVWVVESRMRADRLWTIWYVTPFWADARLSCARGKQFVHYREFRVAKYTRQGRE